MAEREMDFQRTGLLLWKLVAIHISLIAFVIAIVWLAIDTLAADYLMKLMEKYHVSPTATHQMFVDAVHRYLIWATLSGLLLAFLLSFSLLKRVLKPLLQMTRITQRIAEGDYSVKVPVLSQDEIGQLALSFNRMAESLQRIEQFRKKMVLDVAHELRTPITNIQGYLEALTDGVLDPSQKTFESLQEETVRLVRLVEDLLRLSKADAARANLYKRGIPLANWIMQVLDSFKPQFQAQNIVLEIDLPDRSVGVQADPDKLLQVVNNLLQNALQYTPPGGRVKISSARFPGEVKVIFANTGGEIEANDLPYIFERFYRGEKSRSREHGGAGIGLAIVKELIEAHNGRVGAEVFQGEVQIWFTLPVQSS
jgi:two-component system sensor histidine kinase BaeS